MFSMRPRPFLSKRPAATAQPLLLGTAVRLHNKGTTGIVIGSSPLYDRVRVRWDDTGEVTHCIKTSLARVR
jgi:hypothetical protein